MPTCRPFLSPILLCHIARRDPVSRRKHEDKGEAGLDGKKRIWRRMTPCIPQMVAWSSQLHLNSRNLCFGFLFPIIGRSLPPLRRLPPNLLKEFFHPFSILAADTMRPAVCATLPPRAPLLLPTQVVSSCVAIGLPSLIYRLGASTAGRGLASLSNSHRGHFVSGRTSPLTHLFPGYLAGRPRWVGISSHGRFSRSALWRFPDGLAVYMRNSHSPSATARGRCVRRLRSGTTTRHTTHRLSTALEVAQNATNAPFA